MIEQRMVLRMARRGALVAPFVVAGLGFFGNVSYALSGAVGMAMALLNLWIAARIIGLVAEHQPQLLLFAGLAGFAVGLGLLTLIAFGLRAWDGVNFPVAGFTLIGSHLGLVLWDMSSAYKSANLDGATASVRSRRGTTG